MSRPKPRSPAPSPEGPAPEAAVPKAVANRLSLYLRELALVIAEGSETTSSSELGRRLGFTDAQVRKDLAYFGHFGSPGVGYRCQTLVAAIRKILGTDEPWPAALVGVGNLGRALLGYRGFSRQGFRVVAAFDSDPSKVGTTVEGVIVCHPDRLPEVVATHRIRLAIMAVPAAEAQTVAERLVEVGIEGILNFAPVTLNLPERISTVGVDLAIQLEQLSFSIVTRQSDPPAS